MLASLEIWLGAQRRVAPLEGARVSIGRQESNDIVLGEPEASRVHAVLELVGTVWVIRDLSSRNGTRVNGERIAADRPLRSGDEIRIGGTRLTFHDARSLRGAPTVAAAPPPALTLRERDVLVELVRSSTTGDQFSEPASTREIARSLYVSEAAVKQHLSNLYEKFGIHSGLDRRRVRLANEALRRGAVSIADVTDRRPAAVADVTDRRPAAVADVTDRRPAAVADVTDRRSSGS